MNRAIAQLAVIMAMMEENKKALFESDKSTEERMNTCPECGKNHYDQNRLCCSAKCYKALRKRQKEQRN